MGDEASGFLQSWILTNVHAKGYQPDGDLTEAATLAEACVALAAAQAITRPELEAEVGDLDEHMRAAVESRRIVLAADTSIREGRVVEL